MFRKGSTEEAAAAAKTAAAAAKTAAAAAKTAAAEPGETLDVLQFELCFSQSCLSLTLSLFLFPFYALFTGARVCVRACAWDGKKAQLLSSALPMALVKPEFG